jgi:nucleotide-binding universal stress UspA family protein
LIPIKAPAADSRKAPIFVAIFEGVYMTPASLGVHLVPGALNENLLRFTADLAGRLKVKEVIGIAACQPLLMYGEGALYVTEEVFDLNRVAKKKEVAEANARFRAVLAEKAATVEWRSQIAYSPTAEYIAEQMRAADLLITGSEPEGFAQDAPDGVRVADLVMQAGRPVLVVGPDTDRLDLENVVIGWKDSREGRRAVEDALPLLRLAENVRIVEITPEEQLPEARIRLEDVTYWLKRHDIPASTQAIASTGGDAERLGAISRGQGAGLLVAGAYGHHRLREWALGGVTRDLLLKPTRCSFVSH